MKALILVGGPRKGTRFRPLSLDLPKPLFPIAGEAMIYHHIEACASVPGLTEVILLGFYEATAFKQFIDTTSAKLKIKISYLNEVNVLGTAGGLYHFKGKILEGNPANIFILHADICCGFPLNDLLAFHKGHGQACTIMGTTVPKEYTHNYGCLVKDDNTHELLHYAEKPETFVSDLINSGVYCFTPAFFDIIGNVMAEVKRSVENSTSPHLHSVLSRSGTLHPEDVLRLEQDVFVPLAGNKRLYVYEYKGFWRQIKNAGASVYCNDLYTKHFVHTKPDVLAKGKGVSGNVIIHPTAQVHESAIIGPNVTIGADVRIAAGVRIANSIVLDRVEVQEHACVMYAILAWDSGVGSWARVEGIPNQTPHLYVNDKRQGVTIIGRESMVEREVMIRNCIVMPHKVLERNVSNEILL